MSSPTSRLLGANTVPDDAACDHCRPEGSAGADRTESHRKISREGGRLFVCSYLSVDRPTGFGKNSRQMGRQYSFFSTRHREGPGLFVRRPKVSMSSLLIPHQHPLGCARRLASAIHHAARNRCRGFSSQPDNGLKAEEIVFFPARVLFYRTPAWRATRKQTLVVAVEKGAPKARPPNAVPRGSRHGDSLFIATSESESAANRELRASRGPTGCGASPYARRRRAEPINEYKLMVTNVELQTIQWVLLAGMRARAAVRRVVWLRRRKIIFAHESQTHLALVLVAAGCSPAFFFISVSRPNRRRGHSSCFPGLEISAVRSVEILPATSGRFARNSRMTCGN